uniref:Uncharacterized protein n=1 Tax=Physcomitrium patens TaxID=3218 RepID=A0A2K1J9C7_PHYPA|nr:hypothetical protein PHYPA_021245 [Physcomitrium patens]
MTMDLPEFFALPSKMKQENWRTELPGMLTVRILLSNAVHVNPIQELLWNHIQDMNFKVRGSIITVSFYPPSNDFDANKVLSLISSHDANARIISQEQE